MFSKKPHSDVKKSSLKVLDAKKDSLSRLKHLRIVLENSDISEAKAFFENNYSHIYYIFYDVFISVENNLKQRAHHRAHREELDVVRFIFEKLLLLLPELLSRRWQCHSIQRIMKKLLHPGNSVKLRREGVRLFLLWYQILGDNAPEELDSMFTTLVPGILPGIPNPYITGQNQSHGSYRGPSSNVDVYQETSTFYASTTVEEVGPVCPGEILPILPPQSGEQQPDDVTRSFLDCLLEFMVSQVCKVEWKDKTDTKFQKCFHFLFEKFKKYYLPHIFPEFSSATNLYKPLLDLPELRYESDLKYDNDTSRFPQKDTIQQCQSIVIRWITHFTQCIKKPSVTFQQPVLAEMQEQNETNRPVVSAESDSTQSTTSLLSATSVGLERDPSSSSLVNDELSYKDYTIVRDTLYCSRENINLVHEIFRQAFLMLFNFAPTMRKVVAVYREWIQKNSSEKPLFLDEPPAELENSAKDDHRTPEGSLHSLNSSLDGSECYEPVGLRLRKDSYLKAIHSDHSHLKAGLQNMLQIFISNAANVFLLELSSESIEMLEEQVDMCKRVLNIYRYMVMNVQMERRVWEQLLLVLLQITSLVLREVPPLRKENILGGRLAPALFQTLIVTWIKANLNVVISTELWDQFLHVLSSLTQWEELIKEWAKTMETLTRVLAKQVYCLDLNDLPLERLSERKMKKTRAMKKSLTGGAESKLETNKSLNGQSMEKSTFHNGSVYDDTSSQGIDRGGGQVIMRTRSGSGDTSRKRGTSPEQVPIRKSASDSNLCRKSRTSRTFREPIPISSPGQKQMLVVTGASPSVEEELSRIIPQFEDQEQYKSKRMYPRQKSKSLDFLAHRAESPCFSESSECRSRSPSPTPSSGLENTSIKDSPMQIDVLVSSTDNSCNNSGLSEKKKKEIGNPLGMEARSIMSGGTTKGWLSDVAVVLWKRMLGALGDINLIKDATIHAQVLKYLVDLSELLIKIRDNLGVSLDNQSSPPPPELIPPLHLIAPWLFQAIYLPEKYKQGKLLAYRLLCMLTLRPQDLPVSRDYLAQFYHALHYGLVGTDQEIINTIIRSCGPKFFAVKLPGCTLLLMDFIYAADTIASSSDLKGVPRTEALSILGALLCFPNVYKDIPTLQPSVADLLPMICKDAKDHITGILFKAGKREPAGLARCIAINSIGVYLYEELKHKTNHYRIKEAITVLLTAVRFNCKAVAQLSSDMLLLLCDHADQLLENYPDLLRKIVEVLSSTLSNLLPSPDTPLSEEDKKLILSLIYCLGEWAMHLSQNFLTQVWSPFLTDDSKSPLLSIFKVLNAAASGTKTVSSQPPRAVIELSAPDVDPNIHLDNLQDGTSSWPPIISKSASPEKIPTTTESSFFRPSMQSEDFQRNHNILKLAARNVMNHIVNHLGHFPMGVGAARLTSLVNEHDDVPTLTGDELSAEVFHAPNIQFFVLNNCSIISFVEIPAVELPGGGATAGLATFKSQVRIIVRDLSGKFSWDCSILYGPPESCGGSYCVEPHIKGATLHVPVQPGSLSSSTLSLTGVSGSLPDHTFRHRPPDVLPTVENSADDLDNLDDLLQFIGHTSPECVSKPGQPLNSPPKLQSEDSRQMEMDTMNLVLNQRNLEQNQLQKYSGSSSMEAKSIHPPQPCDTYSPFQHCRLLLNQLGYTSWEKRPHCNLLKKNEQLLRELRHLDKQKCRETHKIAVIYVAEGQEDKNSILLNSGGSQEFEEFVAGLGWEVELESHLGFLGGLQRNKSTGDTAPYYATSFLEVIFHVSTRMPASLDDEAMTIKVRHLGNDEVHIVWSEHYRDYRKEIIATEFCDVLIVIYPIGGRLYRIHISRKLQVPFFGPLFNGTIVDHKVLPGLVRATAVNASRAIRSLVSLYQNFYEERAKSLETIVQNHKDTTTFEQFAASVYSPAPVKSYTPSRSSGPPSRTDSTSSRGIPNLAAALLDAHGKSSGYSPTLRNRPISQSTTESMSPHSSPQSLLRGQKERPLSATQTQT